MRIPDIIAAKRDGRELSEGEISEIVLGYARDSVPDYQMSAFLMAAFIRGLSPGETLSLTRVMVESGRVLNLSCVTGTKVDKHSTGGVGDKTTLIVVPILAACGLKVPKMSGRGLGFTGGTLDKLESIPGFRTALSVEEFAAQVQRIGAAIAGQTRDIVPADKKIYALRDVTATVDSLPLIAASVMSKKIACSADIIVLDVKAGSGAFTRDLTSARDLARMMVEIGHGFGRTVGAAITNMDQPLGQAVGNALEVEEAVRVLKGEVSGDLEALCVSLSALALELAGVAKDTDKCASIARQALSSGAALAKFAEIVSAQGGDRRVVEDLSLLSRAAQVVEVRSPGSGAVASIDGARLGRAASLLGAGRERKEDRIDPAAGLTVIKKLGDHVELGEPLALIHTNKTDPLPIAEQMIRDAYVLGSEATIPPLVHEVIR